MKKQLVSLFLMSILSLPSPIHCFNPIPLVWYYTLVGLYQLKPYVCDLLGKSVASVVVSHPLAKATDLVTSVIPGLDKLYSPTQSEKNKETRESLAHHAQNINALQSMSDGSTNPTIKNTLTQQMEQERIAGIIASQQNSKLGNANKEICTTPKVQRGCISVGQATK